MEGLSRFPAPSKEILAILGDIHTEFLEFDPSCPCYTHIPTQPDHVERDLDPIVRRRCDALTARLKYRRMPPRLLLPTLIDIPECCCVGAGPPRVLMDV